MAPSRRTPAGAAIGPAADVPVGDAAGFSDPGTGDPSIVLQPRVRHVRGVRRGLPARQLHRAVGPGGEADRVPLPRIGVQRQHRCRPAGPGRHRTEPHTASSTSADPPAGRSVHDNAVSTVMTASSPTSARS